MYKRDLHSPHSSILLNKWANTINRIASPLSAKVLSFEKNVHSYKYKTIKLSSYKFIRHIGIYLYLLKIY